MANTDESAWNAFVKDVEKNPDGSPVFVADGWIKRQINGKTHLVAMSRQEVEARRAEEGFVARGWCQITSSGGCTWVDCTGVCKRHPNKDYYTCICVDP